MNIIETTNLSHCYWRTEAVHDLTLAVPEGSVCALLGPNGAGKTTTLKMLMNLLRSSAGAARVLGVDSRRLGETEFARIGYVSENQQQPLWMTVRELLDYCRPFYPAWDRELEKNLLRRFELPEERKLKHLSRGMLMKAVLVSSLAYRPRLLVLDEPFTGLDPLVRDEFVTGLLEAADLGNWTMLVSSHDIDDVERLTDCVVMLEGGRLRLAEETDHLTARFRRMEIQLSAPAAAAPVPAAWLDYEATGQRVRLVASDYADGRVEALCAERFPGATVTIAPMSLKEIFISLARQGRKEAKGATA